MLRRISILFMCFALIIGGCTSKPNPMCGESKKVQVYQATDIDHSWIDFIWVEIPLSSSEGTFPGRLFIASDDPFGIIVPSMIELPCMLSSPDDSIDFSPVQVEFEMKAGGNINTSYFWRSCARCSECYMVWSYILDFHGLKHEKSLIVDVILNETFHSQPVEVITWELEEVALSCTEPHMICRAGGKCSNITFKSR